MRHKGPDILITSFKRLRKKINNIELHLYGYNGGDNDYFRKFAVSEPETGIFFHGSVDNTEVPSILRAMDILVIPSKWYENSPIIIYESYLTELPFITSDIGGMKELAEETGLGTVFKNNDSKDLEEKMLSFIEGKVKLNYNKKFKEAIELKNHLTSLEEIYERIL